MSGTVAGVSILILDDFSDQVLGMGLFEHMFSQNPSVLMQADGLRRKMPRNEYNPHKNNSLHQRFRCYPKNLSTETCQQLGFGPCAVVSDAIPRTFQLKHSHLPFNLVGSMVSDAIPRTFQLKLPGHTTDLPGR